jgi:hypothetical protein
MKLTNEQYQLPVLQAKEPIKSFTSGVNKPVLMRCVNQLTGENLNAVVKLKDGERMTIGSSHAFELLGAWLAREMNILVPEPVIIEIPQELYLTSEGSDYYGRLQRSVGYCFGSEYLDNLTQPNDPDILCRQQIIDLQRILLFDLMVINPDRTPIKINMLTDNKRVYAIDHELSFASIPFMLPSRRNPWELNPGDINSINDGIIQHLIQNKRFDLEPFVSDIQMISEDFWSKALRLIPETWYWEHWNVVSSFILEITQHAEEFVQNTRRTVL